jgi:hypothetical protein
MNKKRKLELEIMAVQLWFKTFGYNGMSSEKERIHMCTVLNRLNNRLSKIKK